MKYIIALLLLTLFLVLACSEKPVGVPEEAGTLQKVVLHAYDYAPGYFLLDTSYKEVIRQYFQSTVPTVTPIANFSTVVDLEVWMSKPDITSFNGSNQPGVAFADIKPIRYREEEQYPRSMLQEAAQDGRVFRSNWTKIDPSQYTYDARLGTLHIKTFQPDRHYAVFYRIDAEDDGSQDDDLFYGTTIRKNSTLDTLILKLIYVPDIKPEYNLLWQRILKNNYSFGINNIDPERSTLKIFYINDNNDTLEVLDTLKDKLVSVFGIDRFINYNNSPGSDGQADLMPPIFNKTEGVLTMPSVQPFDILIKEYLARVNRKDLFSRIIDPELYSLTKEEVRGNYDKDRFLIVLETRR